MNNNRVVHFEIQVDDPERAIKFYREVFGWEIEAWPGSDVEYWTVRTAPKDSKDMGIDGGLLKRPIKKPQAPAGANAFVCSIMITNFEDSAEKIKSAGGKLVMDKFAIPKMGWAGYFLDPEENVFGIFQLDENAEMPSQQ